MPFAGVPSPRPIQPQFALQMEPEQTYSPTTAPLVPSPRQFSQPMFAPQAKEFVALIVVAA